MAHHTNGVYTKSYWVNITIILCSGTWLPSLNVFSEATVDANSGHFVLCHNPYQINNS